MTPLSVPQTLLHDVAVGVDSPAVLQTRYSLDESLWEQLSADPFFQKQVEAKRADLKREGVTFRYKAALMAEDLLEKVYIDAVTGGPTLRLDTAKWLTKVAALEPKEEKNAVAPTGFSITINMGGQTMTLGQDNTIDVTPSRLTREPSSLDELPDPPAHLLSLFTPEPLTISP